jgi:parvulin-like peptidyl-prolyl isomerase
LDELIFGYTIGATSDPVYDEAKTKDIGYWLVQVLEMKEEPKEAHVQVMLLSSEEEAQDILDRMEEGEDFVQLAEEFSQIWSDANKADLGWVAPGDMGQAFDDFVFNPETELNTTSSPIKDETEITEGGYWLFKVLESDTREISEEDRDILVAPIINEWLVSLWDDPEDNIDSYLDEEMREFAINKVLEG